MSYDVFIMTKEENAVRFDRKTLSGRQIPSSINGESGRHICYVVALTELIAEDLMKTESQYGLNTEEIKKIALASSLHDIGKTCIPSSILEKKETLTPVEFDIVKKHTILGCDLLDQGAASLEKDILAYAKEISLHHHERFDGTGYPHGLKGEEIPICAQIVSIADAYEALTDNRSYKKAISDDVALEMIANGMCGVFNPKLIQSLLHVADHNKMDEIRNSVIASRAVRTEVETVAPEKVLLLGNVQYLTETFIAETFPNTRVFIVGKCDVKTGKGIKVIGEEVADYKAVFDTYGFQLVLYFSNELSYGSTAPSDMETLRQILENTKYLAEGGKFLYLSSLDASFLPLEDRGIISAAKEKLCSFWAGQNQVDVKVIRIPYLYSGTVKGDFLHALFEQGRAGKKAYIPEFASSRMYFLSMLDLSELISRIIDTWAKGEGILIVNDEFRLSFDELCQEIQKQNAHFTYTFTGEVSPKSLELKNTSIRQQYGWFSKISIITDLEEQYQNYLHLIAPKKSGWEKWRQRLRKYAKIVKVIELLLLFVLCECLVQITGSTLFFSIVDFRMAYIVIMGTMYGLPYGIGAAALSSVSWFVAKIMSGTNWLTLFYEPTNWLAFIFFFLVGAICGYVKLKKDEKIRFTMEENQLLSEKLAFTRSVYEDTFREKQDLKKQIIGSRDSFGKIFDITRQLNTVNQRELYLKIVNSFEDILDNKTISVYSIDEKSQYGRLEVASKEIVNTVSRSISLETYSPLMEVLLKGEVWRNIHLIPNLPMYAYGIFQDQKPLMIIFIWSAQPHQRSLYYVNLFRIMCDLTQMSLVRSRGYNKAMRDQQYLQSTIIQNPETLRETYRMFRELENRKIFHFICLSVDRQGEENEALSLLLSKCVRTNDVVGVLEDDSLWILLSQAEESDLPHILPRFQKNGIAVVQKDLPAVEACLARKKQNSMDKSSTKLENLENDSLKVTSETSFSEKTSASDYRVKETENTPLQNRSYPANHAKNDTKKFTNAKSSMFGKVFSASATTIEALLGGKKSKKRRK